MISGFTNAFRDADGLFHLYFFPGVDDSNRAIYKLDIVNSTLNYKFVKHPDRAIEYIFLNKDLVSIDLVMYDLINRKSDKLVERV